MAQSDDTRLWFSCPRCKELVESSDDAAGATLKCPMCELALTVPTRQKKAGGTKSPEINIEEVGEYGLHDDPEPPGRIEQAAMSVWSTYSSLDTSSAESETDESGDEEDEDTEEEQEGETPTDEQAARQSGGKISLWRLFFVGTFSFPFYLRVQAQIAVSILLALPMIVCVSSAMSMAQASETAGGAIPGSGLLLLLYFSLVSLVLGCLWGVVASVNGLAVLHDTSYECEQVEWPRLLGGDAMGEFASILSSLFFAALPGLVVAMPEPWPGWLKAIVVTISGLVFFPTVLMSILEKNSPVQPVSLPVWRSLIRAWPGWLMFYLATVIPAGAVGALLVAITYCGGWWSGVIASSVALGVGWMTYFRLLGRLAWLCLNVADADSLSFRISERASQR